jgi:hypothetical protein
MRLIGVGFEVMLSELQLREQLAKFISGEKSRDDFEDWFVRESWNIHKSPELGAQRLVNAIELLLAENSSEHLSDPDLLKELKALASIQYVNYPNITSGSTATTYVIQPMEVLSVDTRLAKACA